MTHPAAAGQIQQPLFAPQVTLSTYALERLIEALTLALQLARASTVERAQLLDIAATLSRLEHTMTDRFDQLDADETALETAFTDMKTLVTSEIDGLKQQVADAIAASSGDPTHLSAIQTRLENFKAQVATFDPNPATQPASGGTPASSGSSGAPSSASGDVQSVHANVDVSGVAANADTGSVS